LIAHIRDNNTINLMDDCSVSKYYVLLWVNMNNCLQLTEEQLTLRFAIWVYEIYVLLI